MPIIRSATKPTDVVYDAWGNIIRSDWAPVPGKTYEPGQPIEWQISGETNAPGVGYTTPGDPSLLAGYTGGQALLQQALADPLFQSGGRSYAAGAPGVQSVNAYNNALLAQGINPAELPYGQVGQIATARVQQAHGIPLASWLQGFAPSQVAPTSGVSAAPNGTGPAAAVINQISPDVFAPLANADPEALRSSLIQPKQTKQQQDPYTALRNAVMKRMVRFE